MDKIKIKIDWNKNEWGYTLLEVLGVICLLGLVMSLSVFGTQYLIDRVTLEAEQHRIYQDIKHIKMEAIKTESHAHISFPYYSPRDYYILSSPIEGGQRKNLPEGIEFSTIRTGLGGFNPTIRFSPDGTPWGGATIGIQNARGNTRFVVVAAVTGRIRKTNNAPKY